MCTSTSLVTKAEADWQTFLKPFLGDCGCCGYAYEDPDYGGPAHPLSMENSDLGALKNNVSSVQVMPGYLLRVWDGEGYERRSKDLTGNIPALEQVTQHHETRTDANWDDDISAWKCLALKS